VQTHSRINGTVIIQLLNNVENANDTSIIHLDDLLLHEKKNAKKPNYMNRRRDIAKKRSTQSEDD